MLALKGTQINLAVEILIEFKKYIIFDNVKRAGPPDRAGSPRGDLSEQRNPFLFTAAG